ncbi:hypothetical protein PROFUN_10591 [Planoprotostelium fungivorum]|uniref:C2 domain-containing protein n=1 Tax=Planoprotostelium fungivorum TaxID=1890364 RepID=A0A2P6ND38_9EUKA|nr:hypothetical protein PROFUN_10591 [Planoprotostelium fungivorum]
MSTASYSKFRAMLPEHEASATHLKDMKGCLSVNVIEAEGIWKDDQPASVYVRVGHGKYMHTKSVKRHRDTPPVWNQTLEWDSVTITPKHQLKFTLYKKALIGKDVHMGLGRVSTEHILANEVIERWVDLSPGKNKKRQRPKAVRPSSMQIAAPLVPSPKAPESPRSKPVSPRIVESETESSELSSSDDEYVPPVFQDNSAIPESTESSRPPSPAPPIEEEEEEPQTRSRKVSMSGPGPLFDPKLPPGTITYLDEDDDSFRHPDPDPSANYGPLSAPSDDEEVEEKPVMRWAVAAGTLRPRSGSTIKSKRTVLPNRVNRMATMRKLEKEPEDKPENVSPSVARKKLWGETMKKPRGAVGTKEVEIEATQEEKLDSTTAGWATDVYELNSEGLVHVPPEKAGYLNRNSGYVIRRKTTDVGTGKVKYTIYSWSGHKTPPDMIDLMYTKAESLRTGEYAGAIIRKQHQGLETKEFLGSFPENWINYAPFDDVAVKATRVLRIKGRKYLRVVAEAAGQPCICAGECLVLLTPDALWQWNGSQASAVNRRLANDIVRKLVTDKTGKAKPIIIDQGEEQFEFWDALGGRCLPTPADPEEDFVTDEELREERKLFKLISNGVRVHWSVLAEGGEINGQHLLNTSQCLLLDVEADIFVWLGKGAQAVAKKIAVERAKEYAERTSRTAPIIEIDEGFETEYFKVLLGVL